jgi:ABC-type Fe3+-hydroxamate transport system substrate-binding protein
MSPPNSTIDMMGRTVEVPLEPSRIICLVPSLTELLYDLGLGERVLGITKFCIKPNEWYQSKTRVGGTKTVDFDKIKSLNPDLIIANKEENTKEDIEQLMKLYPVWISDINTYKEALLAIEEIAKLCKKEKEGKALASEIEKRKSKYKSKLSSTTSVLYLIWKGPYMAVGKSTYINDILKLLGYTNCFSKERYKEVSLEEIKQLNPDHIFLSSEPYPFKEKHMNEFKEILPNTSCQLVDGELFSWYGSRLLHLFEDNIFV